jgi:hypothetical protein
MCSLVRAPGGGDSGYGTTVEWWENWRNSGKILLHCHSLTMNLTWGHPGMNLRLYTEKPDSSSLSCMVRPYFLKEVQRRKCLNEVVHLMIYIFNVRNLCGEPFLRRSGDSAVGLMAFYGLDGRGDRSSSLGRGKIFLISTSSRPALGPTEPPIHWVSSLLL